MTEGYQAPSVKKAFEILKLLADADHGLGISGLSKTLKLSKSTVHGITAALEELGVIIRDPLNKRYTLGYAMIELGRKGLSRIPLREVAKRHLLELVEKVGQTVFLGVLLDQDILILDVAESSRELKITATSGTKIPLTAGAVGKLFLAAMEEKAALRYLNGRGLPQYTENSITDVPRYLEGLQKIREQGYATDYCEYLQGANAIAVPIPMIHSALAAIWIVGFSSSFTEKKIPLAIEKTITVAQAISQELTTRVSP
ncbi:MAG TPA: IclR family transcriptional regulator [Thermodesulfobacteriota bacterium]|nr:IclR family transcriptional regulator [Deltaproteobacteria bacterium]HNR13375.1 IclR family transcriptional regulator [Thermodesulfobacteriota bacterium]HNU71535.1 IclR family transcriptional regulator [Thermodesulfobacteriota bacterium]HOC38018.1 IclR family transcriptional regulator [Thermodesulfobacteriota bacterium]HQO78660.1 IclR family transcriptional regulator [Thermodesulfobacteriota bacterium]